MNQQPKQLPSRVYLYFGGACLVVALVLALWAFAHGNLTDDQRRILQFALPIASGLAAGAFVGHATGRVGGVVGTLTGGFLVWFVAAQFLTPPNQPFSFTVYVQADARPDWNTIGGRVVLQIPAPITASITDGHATLNYIPAAYANKSSPLSVEVRGYTNPRPSVLLKPNDSTEIKIAPDPSFQASQSPPPLTASPVPVAPGSYQHRGSIGALFDHIQEREPLSVFHLTLGSKSRAALRSVWVDANIRGDSWGEVLAKLCERYDSCVKCTPPSGEISKGVLIELREPLAIVPDKQRGGFTCPD